MQIKVNYTQDFIRRLEFITNSHLSEKGISFRNTISPILVHEFDQFALTAFKESFDSLLDAGCPIIPVIVDSYGGEAYSLLGMMDVIEYSPVPVLTYSTSKSMSCGAFLAAFGTKGYRYVSHNSTIMLHGISGFSWGKLAESKSYIKEMERLEEVLFAKLDNIAGKEQHFFKALIKENLNSDLYLSAAEAKDYGLFDHVGCPVVEYSYNLSCSNFTIKNDQNN